MLTILCARAGQDMLRELLERMSRSQAGRRLLLVPEQYSHDAERAICRILGNAGGRNCEVLSFTRLWARVSDAAGGGATAMLDAGGRMLLLYRALRQVSNLLSGYGPASRKPAFLNELLSTLDECRSYGVTPEKLTAAAERVEGTQGERLKDIGLVYGAYETLAAQGRADPRARLDLLAEKLEESRWAAGKEFWVWGFTDFTPQEENVLRALLKTSPVTVALTCDLNDPAPIFDPAKRSANYLARVAESVGAPVSRQSIVRPLPWRESLAHLEEQLFAEEPEPWAGDCDVVRVRASDPRQELEWAAAEILRLVREEGYRFRDIAVCARDFSSRATLADGVFGQYGIPLFHAAMDDILQKPVLALVTSALSAVAEGYPYEAMFRYLKTDLTGLNREERDLLENYVITWNIRGNAWTRKKPWDMHPDGYGKKFQPEDTALVERLDGIRKRVIAPLETLRKCKDRTGKGRALALCRFLEDIDLPQRLEERAASLEERGDLTNAAQYRQLWEILAGALEQCALLLLEVELEPEEFSRLFSLALGQYSVGAIPVSLDRVTAGDAPRLSGRRVKALFFLGADSGSVPQCSPAPGLFTDEDREALEGLDLRLAPRQENKLQRELTILYEVCSLPCEKLYVSYPAGGEAARAPSFLYQRMELLFPDAPEVRPDSSCRLAAPGPALELCGADPAVAEALAVVPGYRERVERIRNATDWRRGQLSPLGVRAIYGRTAPMSATRLDLLNSCHFSHFLKYGLGAKPRQSAAFRPSNYGTFIHAVLEDVLTRALHMPGGIQAIAVDRAGCRALALSCAEKYKKEVLAGLTDETIRFRHIFHRMEQAAQTVAESVCGELAASDFTPAFLELGFGQGKEKLLPPVEVTSGITVQFTGFVDRVDSWEHDGKRYLRVVDYKTGQKSFDFSDVADGRGLQMLLYLFALRREGERLFGRAELVPAGALYVPARDPIVNGSRSMTEKQIVERQQKELCRKGLVLDEAEVLSAMEHTDGAYRYLPVGSGRGGREYLVTREQLDLLEGCLTRALERAARELSNGNVDADPYWRNDSENACRLCDYAEACHFETVLGDVKRPRRALTAGEFWKRMEMETENETKGQT